MWFEFIRKRFFMFRYWVRIWDLRFISWGNVFNGDYFGVEYLNFRVENWNLIIVVSIDISVTIWLYVEFIGMILNY